MKKKTIEGYLADRRESDMGLRPNYTVANLVCTYLYLASEETIVGYLADKTKMC
jgi:hypothetical protein